MVNEEAVGGVEGGSEAALYYRQMYNDLLEWQQLYGSKEFVAFDGDTDMTDAMREFYAEAPRLWSQQYIRLENGSSLTFADRPWMKQIWDDTCFQIAIQKPTQVGATVWAYCTAFHRSIVRGQTGIYTMPTAADVSDFVSGRLDRIIDNSPLLATLMNRVAPDESRGRTRTKTNAIKDNSKVKQIGRGTVYFRGTQTSRSAVSVPAHFLIHDELDLSVPEILEMYQHRLDALPAEQWQIYHLSTPTVPNFGINQRVKASSAFTWLLKCEGCNRWQTLNYWEQTRGVLDHLACPRCSHALNPEVGLWVAEHPELVGEQNGYYLNRLMMAYPNAAGASLLMKLHSRRREARFQRHFYNMDLGLVSSEGAFTISREQLLAANFTQTAYPYPTIEFQRQAESVTGPYFMGVDQGDTLTITIGRADPRRDEGRFRVMLCIRMRDPQRGSDAWRFVDKMMEAYKIQMCVVDGNPNSAPAHDLAKKFPGRVLVCYYKDGQRTQVQTPADVEKAAANTTSGILRGLASMKVDSTTRVDISVERTESLDITASDLIGGAFMLPSEATNPHPEVLELMQQVENNVRRPVEDKKTGEQTFRWDRKGPNDYFHSLNYLRIAREEGMRLRTLGNHVSAPVVVHGVPTPGASGRSRR